MVDAAGSEFVSCGEAKSELVTKSEVRGDLAWVPCRQDNATLLTGCIVDHLSQVVDITDQ